MLPATRENPSGKKLHFECRITPPRSPMPKMARLAFVIKGEFVMHCLDALFIRQVVAIVYSTCIFFAPVSAIAIPKLPVRLAFGMPAI
jgi:hypothetical protein